MTTKGTDMGSFHWLPNWTDDVIEVSRLQRIGRRPTMRHYLVDLWHVRHFILEEARGRSFQMVRGTILGRLWLLVEPFINTAMYLVVFGFLLPTGRNIENFLGYLFVGSIMFTAIQRSFAPAGGIIRAGQGLVRSFSFPRAALVVSFAIRNLINTLPAIVAMLGFIMVAGDRVTPTIHWLAFPLVVLLMTVFNLGLSFAVASWTARVPDLKFVWQLSSTFWFMVSGVFFDASRYHAHPTVGFIMEANPAFMMLSMSRDLLLYQRWPSGTMWLHLCAWAFGLLVIGFLVFWRSEESYGTLNER